MPGWLQALVVGIVQGLTEYLPVSSSGHIELAQAVLGYKANDEAALSVILHLGTVLSTVVVLRAEIWRILRGLLQFKNNEEWQFSLRIVVSMIPAAVVGLLWESELEALFEGRIFLVGALMWLTALLLYFASQARKTERRVGYGEAIWMGLAQMVAILPGVSRSGSTIATAVILRVDKTQAAQFSFLMVVPLILGKIAKDLLDGKLNADVLTVEMLAGFLAAFLVGIVACRWMIGLVQRGRLIYFALYCALVGSIAMLSSFFV